MLHKTVVGVDGFKQKEGRKPLFIVYLLKRANTPSGSFFSSKI